MPYPGNVHTLIISLTRLAEVSRGVRPRWFWSWEKWSNANCWQVNPTLKNLRQHSTFSGKATCVERVFKQEPYFIGVDFRCGPFRTIFWMRSENRNRNWCYIFI